MRAKREINSARSAETFFKNSYINHFECRFLCEREETHLHRMPPLTYVHPPAVHLLLVNEWKDPVLLSVDRPSTHLPTLPHQSTTFITPIVPTQLITPPQYHHQLVPTPNYSPKPSPTSPHPHNHSQTLPPTPSNIYYTILIYILYDPTPHQNP